MHFGSRHDHLGYRRVATRITSTWHRQESSIYNRRSVLLNKGNRVHTVGELLTIKIGGDTINKKKKKCKLENNRIKSTKYTIISFLPQNLLEQFRRIANFYFLVMTIIASLIVSPVSPLTSLMPLIFVIAVTASKQGYEDYLRYKADNMVNHSLVTVIRNGIEEEIKCQDIIQGDLVRVTRDCDVPCDLVLLKTSDSYGKCFITTANLDGETNLKTLHIPKGLPKLNIDKLHTLGTIECEQSKTDLYTFNGKIELSNTYRRTSHFTELDANETNVLPLMAENLLLRGSRVKNTEWGIGCAVYTGQNTKLALNSRLTRNKIASSEKYINKFLVFILVLLICIVIASYFLKRYYDMFVLEHHTYIGKATYGSKVSEFLQDFLSFLILFNYLIPISLYVTIEMHKFLGSFFMEWDPKLYDDITDQPCIVNTSDLNEELGQVNVLFSDKTGTLTKNEMLFQQCSIKGRKYVHKGTSLQDDSSQVVIKLNKFNEDQFTFFKALSICHTVQVAGTIEDEQEDVTQSAETVQKVYTFNNIKEESILPNNRAESEPDEVDFINVSKVSNAPTLDGNPLLGEIEAKLNEMGRTTYIKKIRNERQIQAETLSKTMFIDNRVYPINQIRPGCSNIEINESGLIKESFPVVFENSISATNDFQTTTNGRPISLEFYRSNSNIEQVCSSRQHYQTHRRVQSYGDQSSYQKQKNGSYLSMKRSISTLRRNASFASRESYAAPFFTAASLIHRKESARRRDEIRLVVEKLDYQASSPDEKALVEACATLGFLYTGDDDDVITINLNPPHLGPISTQNYLRGTKILFKRLQVLEFSSDRKRMSVIVKDKRDDIWMYTKGAESHIFPLCSNRNKALIARTNQHINDFAKQGLRTLAIARRKLTEEEYHEFHNEFVTACNSFHNRKTLIDECYMKIERNLELLGATAVEDALQDDVCDTLESLQAAGIKIWVLTGDKVETALNIALSCGHISEDAEKYFITECCHRDDIKEHLTILEREIEYCPHKKYAILIDGKSLTIALKEFANRFRDVSIKCRAVLCCRLSPLQKCEVVQLIKSSPEKFITAAIGDGANDVSMIQEAHVGLGIVGKEGRQAARCADFAFANFSMLKRVLLVHGHYFTMRLSLLVLYFFYKNSVFMIVQFFFLFNNMFSTQSIYDSLFLTLYNVIYTALPILFISLTEKPYSEETLLGSPKLYKENTNNERLHWRYFLGWMSTALYHGLVIYMFTYYVWSTNNAILVTPYTVDFSCYGTFLIHNVVVLVNIKLWLEAIYQSYMFIGTIWISIISFAVTTIFYNIINIQYDTDIYWTYNNLLMAPTFWLFSFLIVITALVPDYTIKSFKKGLKLNCDPIFPNYKRNMNTLPRMRTNVQSTYL